MIRSLPSAARPFVALPLLACATVRPPSPPPPSAVAVAAPPVAPVATPSPLAPAPVPLPELALETHAALFEALRAHDAARLSSLYASDASLFVGLGLLEARGPDAIASAAGTLWTAFPDSKVQWGKLYQSGDAIAVELAWAGTSTGPLGSAPPTKKEVGTTAMLVSRFAPTGRIEAQHVYFDVDAVASDLAHGMKLFGAGAFVGLPTSQTTVLDHAAASAEDDAAMRSLITSFQRGAFEDARPLATATSTWTDAETAHVSTGKAAIASWVSFLGHSFKGGREPLMDAWSTGEDLILEWSTSSGAAIDPGAAGVHAAEVVSFEGGHIVEVRTYRSAVRKTPPGRQAATR